VALTIQALALRGHEHVLEVGTGSGYAAAILGLLARDVITLERLESLANVARERLARLGHENVRVIHGDGMLGWADHAPYDAIAIAAGGPDVPQALLGQLTLGGRLVIPVGWRAPTCPTPSRSAFSRYEQKDRWPNATVMRRLDPRSAEWHCRTTKARKPSSVGAGLSFWLAALGGWEASPLGRSSMLDYGACHLQCVVVGAP
jgi:protein-L-isoaspartate O-methyltransferase